MPEEDQPVEDENLETEQGREQGLADEAINAREAAFLEGYENEHREDDEDFGLDDDEKLED